MDAAGVCVFGQAAAFQTMENPSKEDILPKGYQNRQMICWGISGALVCLGG